MPIQFTLENDILQVDFSSLSVEQVRLIKKAINYQEEILDESGAMVTNVPWQLLLLKERMIEIQKKVVSIKEQEIAAQAIQDAQTEIDEVKGI